MAHRRRTPCMHGSAATWDDNMHALARTELSLSCDFSTVQKAASRVPVIASAVRSSACFASNPLLCTSRSSCTAAGSVLLSHARIAATVVCPSPNSAISHSLTLPAARVFHHAPIAVPWLVVFRYGPRSPCLLFTTRPCSCRSSFRIQRRAQSLLRAGFVAWGMLAAYL